MKIRLASLLLGFAAITVSSCALARPVSYAGGWTLIETSNRASSAALLHYTPAYNYSVGARYEWMRGADIRMQAIQPTYLAKRWFGKNYQANLYLTGGVGRAERTRGQTSITETASFAGVMADWETRSLFASYETRAADLGRLGNQTMHAARVGWAPYEGDTGDLHTWLMVEVDRREHLEKLLPLRHSSVFQRSGFTRGGLQPQRFEATVKFHLPFLEERFYEHGIL